MKQLKFIVLFFLFIMFFSTSASASVSMSDASGYYKITTPNYTAWLNKTCGVIEYYHDNTNPSFVNASNKDGSALVSIYDTSSSSWDISNTNSVTLSITINTQDLISIVASNSGASVIYNFYDDNINTICTDTTNYRVYSYLNKSYDQYYKSEGYGIYHLFESAFTEINPSFSKIVLCNSSNQSGSILGITFDRVNCSNIQGTHDPAGNTGLAFGRTTAISANNQVSLVFHGASVTTNKNETVAQIYPIANLPLSLNFSKNFDTGSGRVIRTALSSWRYYEDAWGGTYTGWFSGKFNLSNQGTTAIKIYTNYDPTGNLYPVYSPDNGSTWIHINPSNMTVGTDGGYYYLLCTFTPNSDNIWIAMHIPYTYTDLNDYENTLSEGQFVNKSVIGYSAEGRPIRMIKLTDNTSTHTKKKIYIVADQHAASESGTLYPVEGIINWLTDTSNASALATIQQADVYIVPMANPDGVYNGGTRNQANGTNMNRDWSANTTPEVQTIRSNIETIDPDYIFDLHENQGNNTIYIYQYNTTVKTILYDRVSSKLLYSIDPARYSFVREDPTPVGEGGRLENQDDLGNTSALEHTFNFDIHTQSTWQTKDTMRADGVYYLRAISYGLGLDENLTNVSSIYVSGVVPLQTKFTETSLIPSTAWRWDFENDGIIDSTKQNPVHTYGKAGNYTVNLTVTNEYGNFSTVKTDYITVTAQQPPSTLSELYWWLVGYLGLSVSYQAVVS